MNDCELTGRLQSEGNCIPLAIAIALGEDPSNWRAVELMLSQPPIVERQHCVRSVRACASHAGIHLLPAFDVDIERTGHVLVVSENDGRPHCSDSEILR